MTEAYETLRDEEDKMNTILGRGGQLSTSKGNWLTFLRQELVSVYILSGINYSIINNTRGALTCFKSTMRYTDEELKVKNTITLDIMERLNLQRLSMPTYALLIREIFLGMWLECWNCLATFKDRSLTRVTVVTA